MVKKVLSIGVGVAIVFYAAFSIWIGFSVRNAVRGSYMSYGEGEYNSDIIEFDIFDRMNYRRKADEFDVPSKERHVRTFPLAFHTFNKSSVVYFYWYERRSLSDNELLCGSLAPVQVTVKLKNWKWVVVDYYESP